MDSDRADTSSSTAYPIYDVATILSLIFPAGIMVALFDGRYAFAIVLFLVVLLVDIVAFMTGRSCDLSVMEYLRSTRDYERPRDSRPAAHRQ